MKTAEQRKIEKMEEALKTISNPLAYLQNKAEKEGTTLDGRYAIELSSSPNWLRQIAKDALSELAALDKEIAETNEEESKCCSYPIWNHMKKDRTIVKVCSQCLKEIEQGEEKGLPKNSERDWTEDFPHENGMYQNRCMDCGLLFFGHKRRVWCKLCGGKPAKDKADSDKRKSAEEFLKEKYKDDKWEPIFKHIIDAILEFSQQSVSDEEIMLYFAKHCKQSKEMKINYQVFTRGMVIEFAKWMREQMKP